MMRALTALIIAVSSFTLAGPVPLASAADVSAFLGSWGGRGHATFQDGQRERVTCRAYYTDKPSGMGLALRCASPAYKVEIRSRLKVAGNAVTGSWEETTYNAKGRVEGTLASNKLALNVDAGAFQGEITVDPGPKFQNLALETRGIALTGVTVRLSRMNR